MNCVTLAEVATIERRTVDPDNLDPATPYIGLEHVERGGRIVGRDTVGHAELASVKFVFESDHVLYGKLRPNLAKIARPWFSGVCSTDILPIRPGPRLDRDYLAHYLAQPGMIDFAAARASGANLPRLSPAVLASLRVPLPSLEEQRRIAAILDQTDALRVDRRQVLTHLNSLVPSVFRSVFGRASDILHRWPVEPLGQRLEYLTSGSRGWARYYASSGERFLRIQNVRRDELVLDDIVHVNPPSTAEAARTRVKPGDVLLSITADLGRTAVIPNDIGSAYINQHLCILRAPSVVSRYLSAYLSSASGRGQIRSKNRAAVKAGLNFDDVRSLQIPIPPTSVQQRFAIYAQAIDEQRARVEGALAAADELFVSLQYRAFRGEL